MPLLVGCRQCLSSLIAANGRCTRGRALVVVYIREFQSRTSIPSILTPWAPIAPDTSSQPSDPVCRANETRNAEKSAVKTDVSLSRLDWSIKLPLCCFQKIFRPIRLLPYETITMMRASTTTGVMALAPGPVCRGLGARRSVAPPMMKAWKPRGTVGAVGMRRPIPATKDRSEAAQ